MRYNILLVGAIALVALSLGFPGAGGSPDAPDPSTHSASLHVDLVENLGVVRVILRLDPDAPVVDVEMWSPATDLDFTQEGVDGLWVAEGPLNPDVHCYLANVRVALAEGPRLVPAQVSSSKKAKKAARAKKAGAASKKSKKSKKAAPSADYEVLSLGGVVLELSSSYCRGSDECLIPLN